MRAGIALGSNLGDRSALLKDAISHLKAIHQGGPFLVSTLHETEPVDCDGITLHHDGLELPHPRITERLFVLAPLVEIRPDLRLPGWSMTCSDYLSQIHNN